MRHGHGIFTSENTVYSGEWANGKPNGIGRLDYNPEKTCYYQGEWKDGSKSGQGVMHYVSGNIYNGGWLDNLKHGHGVMVWNDLNERYEGEWKHGQPNGVGIHTWHNNVSEYHQFPMNNSYNGNFVDGLREGYGRFEYSSGARYEGEWKSNLKVLFK